MKGNDYSAGSISPWARQEVNMVDEGCGRSFDLLKSVDL